MIVKVALISLAFYATPAALSLLPISALTVQKLAILPTAFFLLKSIGPTLSVAAIWKLSHWHSKGVEMIVDMEKRCLI